MHQWPLGKNMLQLSRAKPDNPTSYYYVHYRARGTTTTDRPTTITIIRIQCVNINWQYLHKSIGGDFSEVTIFSEIILGHIPKTTPQEITTHLDGKPRTDGVVGQVGVDNGYPHGP